MLFVIIAQVTRKELGVYRAVVSDSRGEDDSVLKLIDDGENIIFTVCPLTPTSLCTSKIVSYK